MVLERYRDEWRDDEMGAAFAQGALDRFRHSGTDLFQLPSIADQSQFVALL